MRDIADYTEKYTESSFEEYQVLYRRRFVCEQIAKYNPKTILEIGCGMLPLFMEFPDKNFTVIEPSENFYENAKKLSCNRKNIELINDFFDEKTILPQRFDMIICSGLLHEVEDPEQMAVALSRIASSESIVHINVPNARSFHRLLAKESSLIDDVHELSSRNRLFQQHSVFDIESLKRLFVSKDFEIVEEGSYFIKPFTHEQMMRMLKENIIDLNVLEGLYKMADFLPEFGSEIFVNCKKR